MIYPYKNPLHWWTPLLNLQSIHLTVIDGFIEQFDRDHDPLHRALFLDQLHRYPLLSQFGDFDTQEFYIIRFLNYIEQMILEENDAVVDQMLSDIRNHLVNYTETLERISNHE